MPNAKLSGAEALERLIAGNARFCSGLRSIESVSSVAKMKELAEKGQSPFAIVLTCSDSRVPTEMVFDCGLGDLFVIRVAGNVVAPSLIASVEFAAANFGSPLCIVMGHSQCGAIKGAYQAEITGAHAPTANLEQLMTKIRPAVRWAMRNGNYDDTDGLIKEATLCNVRRSTQLLEKRSPVVSDLVQQGKLTLVGAVYDIATGRVSFESRSVETLAGTSNSRTLLLAEEG